MSPGAPPSVSAPEELILLGEFGRVRGLKGDIRLKSFTENPADIAGYSPLMLADGTRVAIHTLRPAPGKATDTFLVRIKGVTTCEDAERFTGARLFVEKSRLRPPNGDDEFLMAELIGLAARTPAGDVLGTVVAVPDYGAGALIEIRRPGSPETVLVPFTRTFVPRVDIPGGALTVAWEEETP
ncbi:MAG: ribosome maturation factor RimM [Methylobacteriaceae bacterium]|jgi:16S rRNA processing protein RimM|nr:ribosome maturation factor RimM [Methylobacteriaceae bacterium]